MTRARMKAIRGISPLASKSPAMAAIRSSSARRTSREAPLAAPAQTPHGDVESGVIVRLAEPAARQPEDALREVLRRAGRGLDQRAGVLAVPEGDQLVEQRRAAFEMPVEAAPRDAEPLGQRQDADLIDALLGQHAAGRVDPGLAI